MPNCNRLYQLTFGGWLLGVILCGSALAQEGEQDLIPQSPPTASTEAEREKGGANDEQPAVRDDRSTEEFLSVLKGIESAIRKTAPLEDAEERQRQEQRELSDLQAQQEIARYALPMLIAAIFSVGLTAIGVGLLWKTLIYTGEAARYAKIAADAAVDTVSEARKATEAAWAANETSREIFLATERPWVFATGARPNANLVMNEDGTITLPFNIVFKNCGKIPAFNVHGKVRAFDNTTKKDILSIQRELKNDIEKDEYNLGELKTGVVILSGDEISTDYTLKIPPDRIDTNTEKSFITFCFTGVIKFQSPIDNAVIYSGHSFTVILVEITDTRIVERNIPRNFTSLPKDDIKIIPYPISYGIIPQSEGPEEQSTEGAEADEGPAQVATPSG